MDDAIPNMLDTTLALLECHRGSWPAVCRATGLSYSWLTKLAQGAIPDPSFRRLQKLHDFLQSLDVPAKGAAA